MTDRAISAARLDLFEEIDRERDRQDAKFGRQDRPVRAERAFVPLNDREETALGAKDRCVRAEKRGALAWEHIIDEEYAEALAESDDSRAQRTELVQLAAVIVAAIENIDARNRDEEGA